MNKILSTLFSWFFLVANSFLSEPDIFELVKSGINFRARSKFFNASDALG